MHPAIFATEYAVLSRPKDAFAREVLPVILRAYGSECEPALRAYAALCAAGEEDFITCAQKWLAIKDSNHWRRALFPENVAGQRTALIQRLWTEKKLTVPISALLEQPQ